MSMSISGPPQADSATAKRGRPAGLSQPVVDAPKNLAPAESQRLQQLAAKGADVAAIVERYNLRHISYTDLQKMAQELVDVGALKTSEKLDFVPPPMEYANLDGSRNANWDAPKDYLGLVEQQLKFQQSAGFTSQQSLRFTEQKLNLLQRFEQVDPSTTSTQ